MQMYANLEGILSLKCIAWVGNILTPVQTGQQLLQGFVEQEVDESDSQKWQTAILEWQDHDAYDRHGVDRGCKVQRASW